MLHRKLMLLLGSMIVLLLTGGMGAILLLHGLLEDLIDISTTSVDEPRRLLLIDDTLSELDRHLTARERGELVDAGGLAVDVATLTERIESLGDFLMVPEDGEACYLLIQQSSLKLTHAAAGVVETTDSSECVSLASQALASSADLRAQLHELERISQQHRSKEHQQLVAKFRGTGMAVGIGFLVILNILIVVLLRAAAMILQPVGKLVQASRRLAREEFDFRVHVDRVDEFGELAKAYNSLAEQLQTNEQRKIETLRQVARTLNHELNNAISTIELQLTLLARRSARDQSLAEPLRHIHQSLGRMSDTVSALNRVRRVVLTDYVSGIRMLDLERSVQQESPTD